MDDILAAFGLSADDVVPAAQNATYLVGGPDHLLRVYRTTPPDESLSTVRTLVDRARRAGLTDLADDLRELLASTGDDLPHAALLTHWPQARRVRARPSAQPGGAGAPL